jgi:capsular polysaccharide biosynthesis protein
LDREITLRDYGRVLWRGRWLILVAVVAAGLVGLVLTFVTTTKYSATARVYLGQATTATGVPLTTPITNPTSAPSVLLSDRVVNAVAARTDISASRFRDGITLTIPRTPGAAAGNQPSVATLTYEDESRDKALEVANEYARIVRAEAARDFRVTQNVLLTRLNDAKTDIARLEEEIGGYRQQLAASAGGPGEAAFQAILFSAREELSDRQSEASVTALLIAKANQNEAPEIFSFADKPSSSSSAPRRLRTVLLAALIGLIAGVIVTFVWRGSPAGRGRAE